ncbi:unnamed protein product, partial [Prorocentrum cordatum]
GRARGAEQHDGGDQERREGPRRRLPRGGAGGEGGAAAKAGAGGAGQGGGRLPGAHRACRASHQGANRGDAAPTAAVVPAAHGARGAPLPRAVLLVSRQRGPARRGLPGRGRAKRRLPPRREFLHDHRLEGQFSEPRHAVVMDIFGPPGAEVCP